MDSYGVWSFPKNISIENVSEYVERLKQVPADGEFTFDLRNTVKIHSSFIGFLIHAKHNLNKSGGRLTLLLSSTVERILIMLKIVDHFSPDIVTPVKKTA